MDFETVDDVIVLTISPFVKVPIVYCCENEESLVATIRVWYIVKFGLTLAFGLVALRLMYAKPSSYKKSICCSICKYLDSRMHKRKFDFWCCPSWKRCTL